jgi:RNA polymerase sigma-54 factor
LDSDGYLRVTADDIADSLSFAWQRMVDMETVQRVIEMVQNTGPAGIAANNLQECMLLQLFRKEKKTKYDAIAYGIVEDDFNLLCERNFSTICQKHEINDEDIKMVLKALKRLHASPCNLEDAVNQKARKEDSGIDFVISEDENGKLQGELVESFIGAVKINTVTAETLKALCQKKKKTKNESSHETFLKNKAQAAKWFLDCISQREHSMKLVIDSIISLQEKYLRSGNKQDLVPMVLQDIADRTDLDVSTVSRITSARYAETVHGKLALKDLFTFGIQAANGNLISNINVKEMLLAIINEEDKSNPYTDDQIAKILAGRGIKIARRTVLKYRDEFGLPAAKYRSRKAA